MLDLIAGTLRARRRPLCSVFCAGALCCALPTIAFAGSDAIFSDFAAFKVHYDNIRQENKPVVNGLTGQVAFTF